MALSIVFYRLFLALYAVGVRIAALKSPKARLWIRGRRGIKSRFREAGSRIRSASGPVIWFHCASLGEFEQGRPVMEELKAKYPNARMLVTFFSPSGYEIRKNYALADHIDYLPLDSPANANLLLDSFRPDLVIFVKYEFWYYYIRETKRRNIPLLLISGAFRSDQPFFQWYGKLHRNMLNGFYHLFVQYPHHEEILREYGFNAVTACGDTRFDRVIATAEKGTELPLIEAFCGEHPVLVAGSTWTEDDEELCHYSKTHPEIRFVIAPHEVDEDNISDLEKLFPNNIRYSALSRLLGKAPHPSSVSPEWVPPASEDRLLQEKFEKATTLIIDNIGMLSRLYRYAQVTYVGGGFGTNGLHNILEAAVYGKPVLFGPNHEKFPEAGEMIDAGGAFSVSNALELEKKLDELFQRVEVREAAGKAAREYIYRSKGATAKIVEFIQANRLLTI